MVNRINRIFMDEEDVADEAYVQGYSKGIDDAINKINAWFLDLHECDFLHECHLPVYIVDEINQLKQKL